MHQLPILMTMTDDNIDYDRKHPIKYQIMNPCRSIKEQLEGNYATKPQWPSWSLQQATKWQSHPSQQTTVSFLVTAPNNQMSIKVPYANNKCRTWSWFQTFKWQSWSAYSTTKTKVWVMLSTAPNDNNSNNPGHGTKQQSDSTRKLGAISGTWWMH